MNALFLIVANLAGLTLAAYALYLVVRVRLYVGYAVVWLALIAIGLATLNLPPLRELMRRAAGTEDAQQAWMLLILGAVVFILIYFSVQVTILSKRITDMAAHIVLRETPGEPGRPDGRAPLPAPHESQGSEAPAPKQVL